MAGLVVTPEIEADAQLLAERTGVTPTEAVASALRTRLLQLPSVKLPGYKKSMEELHALFDRHKLTPVNDLTEDEILGYDEFGVPEQPHFGR